MALAYTVTQINSYIKNMFRQDFVLNNITIKGEVSNCKYHSSGHVYFTLKDEAGTLSAIMFASNACKQNLKIEDGMQISCQGRIDVYERDGRYQLYVTKVKQDGLGDLYARFLELKNKFEDMGYFAEEYKRKIPEYASKIGIVTADTGAAIQDIINISKRRNPYVSLILYPAYVQGEKAKKSIVKGIETLDQLNLDVIIVGRGGGSIEDLWAFNEEDVATAIFSAKTPIISAVGHETDFTIADFVSDLRAPTPSAAAELAVCDIGQVYDKIDAYNNELNNQFNKKIVNCRNIVEQYELKLKFLDPVNQINEKRQQLINIQDRINQLIDVKVKESRHALEKRITIFESLSPLRHLEQGYAYVTDASGNRVSKVSDVRTNDEMVVYFKDGKVKSSVTEVINGSTEKP